MSSPEGDSVRPFHLAFPVTDLGATERFYVEGDRMWHRASDGS